MSTKVVSFRVDETDLEALRALGVNPNEFAKACLERGLKRAQAERSIAWYEAHPFTPGDRRPVEDIIREMRDTR